MPDNSRTSDDHGLTLGDILGEALAQRVSSLASLLDEPAPTGMWNIIYGDPKTPKEEWEVYMPDVTNPKEGAIDVKRLNARKREYEKKYEPGGDYYSEMRDGVMYYNVQVEGQRVDYDYNLSIYVKRGEDRWEMLTENDARDRSVRRFYDYEYDKPSSLGYKYTLVKVPVEQDYLAREAARTDNPILLPEELQPYDNSSPFLCPNLIPPNRVSFFKTREDAWENRRTEMRLGRFLSQYVGDSLTQDEIAKACASVGVEYASNLILKMARTREEIKHVYLNGPDSCMSHAHLEIGGIHPVETYAAGDLAVAYLEEDGEIVSRSLCRPDKMKYVRVYGRPEAMRAALEKLGYSESPYCLARARLLRIEVPDRVDQIFIPYLDGNFSDVMDMDDHLIVHTPPRKYTGGTSGVVHVINY